MSRINLHVLSNATLWQITTISACNSFASKVLPFDHSFWNSNRIRSAFTVNFIYCLVNRSLVDFVKGLSFSIVNVFLERFYFSFFLEVITSLHKF